MLFFFPITGGDEEGKGRRQPRDGSPGNKDSQETDLQVLKLPRDGSPGLKKPEFVLICLKSCVSPFLAGFLFIFIIFKKTLQIS